MANPVCPSPPPALLMDLKSLVENLDADAIRGRLREIDAEKVALEVLLRAAVRRNSRRDKQRPAPTPRRGKTVRA